ncbi:PRC-barrel domain-containing protein [Draconibacterium halophilum]|uniref:PRC-barrel domain containing protein n=1 Tax=Draconibacterium halophilum TaxID=2706887 RepID=A0A6C0RAI7_9BACT|nr:PRC-barrel domain-containing protein [Draconibacterium halophilum]QIA07016.1 PRC-barrel domain containing protein [Draconibacterium halophilum]
MKLSIRELLGYSIKAKDGEKGKVNDFLFDEKSWIIRYLEADLGNFFKENRVLIPHSLLGEPDGEEKDFEIELSIDNIKRSPNLSFDMPVSRVYEKKLASHYGIKYPYWMVDSAAFTGNEVVFYPGVAFRAPRQVIKEEDIDTSLRSFNEIRGYGINAIDDQFGHISDMIIDDTDWQILYFVVDTNNLFPWSKKVILPIEKIDKISFTDREAHVDMTKEAIKNSPEYNPDEAVNAEIEKVLYDYHGRKK